MVRTFHLPPEEYERGTWAAIAFCARYGRIDVQDWPVEEAKAFKRALEKIVDDENKQGRLE